MEDQSKVQESTPMITDSNSDAASNNHKNENANDIPIVELSYSQQLVANGWCPVKKEFLVEDPLSRKRKREENDALAVDYDRAEEKTKTNPIDGRDRKRSEKKDENNDEKQQETTTQEIKIGENNTNEEKKEEKKDEPKKEERKSKKHEKKAPKPQLCFDFSRDDCKFQNCKRSHDALGFWNDTASFRVAKPCHLYETYGKCKFGLRCIFAASHTDENLKQKVKSIVTEPPKPINSFGLDFMRALERHQRKFPRTEVLFPEKTKNEKNKNKNNNNNNKNNNNAKTEAVKTEDVVEKKEETNTNEQQQTNESENKKEEEEKQEENERTDMNVDQKQTNTTEMKTGGVSEFKETPLKQDEKKKIDWKGKRYLAPLTTVGNLPFRRICVEYGAEITCGEMALVSKLYQGSSSEWALTKRHPSEKIFGVQICGSNQQYCAQAAEMISDEVSCDFIDFNCGCPIDLVVNKGMGSGMLDKKGNLMNTVEAMSKVSKVPLTVKVRTGRDEKAPTLHKFISEFESRGAVALQLHGRSRLQRYTKLADWNYIDTCSKLTNLPVFGNGDIYTQSQYYDHMENTSVSGCMIARGAIIKPWLFTEIAERRDWDISSRERLEIYQKFANYGLEHFGSDHLGVNTTRTFMLEWHSFLFRYVPLGLIDVMAATPTMNQRPPPFKGRDDMETLLASPNVKDWLKISELFLGPVTPDFHFAPKHKSNSYNG